MINLHATEIIGTGVLLFAIIALRIISTRLVRRYSRVSEVLEQRTNLVIRYISIILTILFVVGILTIWGVKSENVFTTLSAIVTVIGVAMFAQWSILSNITSGIILLFSFPFRIGDIIRVHDKDFPIEAEIEDIRAFHTLLKTKSGELITYPNNLLLQKGISIVPNFYEEKEFTD